MNELIKVGNHEISTKEFKGQRVVTFNDIDLVHERAKGTADRNFRANEKRFIEGEDYFFIPKSQNNEFRGLEIPNRGITAITEQGYLMLVKPFTDDLAWDVQRQLVNTYFKTKRPLTAIEQLQLTQQAILEVKADVDSVNEDLQAFKQDMPLLGIDCDRIKNARNKKIVPLLGGKKSNAYNDKSLRTRVYEDSAGQIWREFGVRSFKEIKRSQIDLVISIISKYELPLALEKEIDNVNAQINIA